MKYTKSRCFGSDLFPIKLYKSIAHYICDILYHISNDCIGSCTFPDLWKIAHITCIPKIPNATINDIRPISLLPSFLNCSNILFWTTTLICSTLVTVSINWDFAPSLLSLVLWSTRICTTSSLKLSTVLISKEFKLFATISLALLTKFPYSLIIVRLSDFNFLSNPVSLIHSFLQQPHSTRSYWLCDIQTFSHHLRSTSRLNFSSRPFFTCCCYF